LINVTLQAINLKQPNESEREALRNLFNLWHHDLAIMDSTLFPNIDDRGFYEYTATDIYFEDKFHDKLLPYFVRYNGELAGFCILSKPPYVIKQGCDWCIQEFFITGNFRRKGIGIKACEAVFSKHPGRYCLEVVDNNVKAKAFWAGLVNSVGVDVVVGNNDTVFSFMV